ncbi:type II toxin-antitoxin system VapB family antitoxin [Mycobacterium avium]|uniref:type II toxin-antitoxin system VapB family antitoxin n=1 Tax=Mycobacterium avium TaxID=1764 RepID=UPI000BB052CE|nr:type II toxin-antitoxin system VapB family antitoxin [Mycobacterium avium]PBA08431.1 antitoxin VapB36 [Mycobacterium avium]
MALNIKDPEVDRLAAEVAARLGITKTAAIRQALNAQLTLLTAHRTDRVEALREVMRTEIWPLLADRNPVSKAEREQILGYDSATGV